MLATTLEKEKLSLTISDRCDTGQCGAQAYVAIRGATGDLFFCAHHYDKIMNNIDGYNNMVEFTQEILDNRDSINHNRLVED